MAEPATGQPAVKVAHVTTVDLSLRYLLLNQLHSLQASGYEVTGISAAGTEVQFLETAGIRHIAAPLTRNVTPWLDLRAMWRLAGIMRRERFAIVHVHTPKAELLGALAARLAGVPIVVDTFRGIYYRSDMHPLWRSLFLAMARVAASCADVVLSQSQEHLDMAVREGICPPAKIKLLGNGIDIARFHRAAVDPSAIARARRELGLPAGQPVIGFAGRLVAEKGILEILEAAAVVQRHVPAARFLFVGPLDTDKEDALTPAIAARYGLDDACLFAGMRHDMPEMYALMDLFLLPSHRESFPRSPMEASAMGVPCIVSDVPGCREVVKNGISGILVPCGDTRALAQAILQFLGDRETRQRMGKAGRLLAEERFNERLIFARVTDEYARLLTEKGLPVPTALDRAAVVMG